MPGEAKPYDCRRDPLWWGFLAGFFLLMVAGSERSPVSSWSPKQWTGTDVSLSYKCGVMRALREKDHQGPADKDSEAKCAALQQAGWSDSDKRIAACMETIGAGNYSDPKNPPQPEPQIACLDHERAR